ncbi:MAG: preprotein translocase subunit YajC [Planctomycetota bacterium]|nr:preprotein translocase subunit YajC [Planctomycetota bacterium]
MKSIQHCVANFALQTAPPKQMSASAATGSAPEVPGATTQAAPQFDIFWIFIPVIVVMIAFSIFGQRKERKKREQLLNNIEKHDKVGTIGGIIGLVVEIKADTVTLKVDEGSNFRITFAKSAVSEVIEKGTAAN